MRRSDGPKTKRFANSGGVALVGCPWGGGTKSCGTLGYLALVLGPTSDRRNIETGTRSERRKEEGCPIFSMRLDYIQQ